MTSRIPPLLESYLSLPQEAFLVLLTSVLGASTNWLVLRYLYSALSPAPGSRLPLDQGLRVESGTGETTSGAEGGEEGAGVVLVSFLRDLAFWREGGRRLGLDLPRLAEQKRFVFVDGLSGLFLPGAGVGKDGEVVLRSAELGKVYEDVLGAVRSLQNKQDDSPGRKVILIIDALDLLLATAGKNASPVRFGNVLMDLREHVHATILTISNDSPLVLRQKTPLEINHATFLLSLAHQAQLSISLRLLDTGTASDVSGVIRISVRDAEIRDEDVQVEAKELLYFVAGDGNVKVFERGQ